MQQTGLTAGSERVVEGTRFLSLRQPRSAIEELINGRVINCGVSIERNIDCTRWQTCHAKADDQRQWHQLQSALEQSYPPIQSEFWSAPFQWGIAPTRPIIYLLERRHVLPDEYSFRLIGLFAQRNIVGM